MIASGILQDRLFLYATLLISPMQCGSKKKKRFCSVVDGASAIELAKFTVKLNKRKRFSNLDAKRIQQQE